MATKARKSAAKKKSARSARKRGATSKRSMRASARKSATKKRSAAPKRRSPARAKKQSTVSRVKRVTREVVQQATVAVAAGVESLRDMGGNLVDRVRSNTSS